MSTRPALPQRHRKLGWIYVAVGGAAWLVAGATGAVGSVWSAPVLAFGLMGLGLGALGVYLVRVGPAVVLANAAIDAIARGQLLEAEARLDAIPKGARRGSVARAVHNHRAVIAMRRGQTRKAVEEATLAIDTRSSLLTRVYEKVQQEHGRSIRALASASLGDGDRARADIAAIRASSVAAPQALALASVAEAALLSRDVDRGPLAALLARDRELLFEYTSPRERALVRALERMVKARGTSAYREAAKREEAPDGNEPPLASWIASVVPAAAAFAPPAGARRESAEPVGLEAQPSPASVARVERAQRNPVRRRQAVRTLVLWVLLVVMFLAIWQFLTPSDRPPSAPNPAPDGPWLPGWITLLIPAAFLALFAYATWLGQRATTSLLRAARALARGDAAAAQREYTRLTRRRGTTGASADLGLANMASRAGRFDECLRLCDAGIAKVAHLKATASDLLMPELLARRAYALAALDRPLDAATQLGVLTTSYPGFAWLSRAQLSVRMMLAVRAGEADKAVALARERTPDLPLDLRDEMLADLVVARADRAPAELVRLDDELREGPGLRSWIAGVAPRVLAEFEPLAAAARAAS